MQKNLKLQWKHQNYNESFFQIMIPKNGTGSHQGLDFYIGINYQKSSKKFSINIKLYIKRKKIQIMYMQNQVCSNHDPMCKGEAKPVSHAEASCTLYAFCSCGLLVLFSLFLIVNIRFNLVIFIIVFLDSKTTLLGEYENGILVFKCTRSLQFTTS